MSTEAQPVAQTPPRGGATSGFGPRQSSDCEAGSDRGAPHSLVPEVSALSTPGQGARSPVPQLKIPRATAETCQSVALMVRDRATRMKTEHEIWCNDSGDLQPLLDRGAEPTLSPAFIPKCRLQEFL